MTPTRLELTSLHYKNFTYLLKLRNQLRWQYDTLFDLTEYPIIWNTKLPIQIQVQWPYPKTHAIILDVSDLFPSPPSSHWSLLQICSITVKLDYFSAILCLTNLIDTRKIKKNTCKIVIFCVNFYEIPQSLWFSQETKNS